MCCSTGVCGPQVDPVLVRLSADLKWLAGQGVQVRRFNLSQSPAAFAENELVVAAFQEKAAAALPLFIANGRVAAGGRYPDRAELCQWLGLVDTTLPKISLTPEAGGCCDGGKCS
jgi:hypothetical protein